MVLTTTEKNISIFMNSLRWRGKTESLFDYIPDIVFFMKDKNRRLVNGNEALVNLLGESSFDNIYGKTGYDYFPKVIAEAFDEDDRWVMEKNRPLVNRIELLIDEGGQIVWHSTTKLPLQAINGRIIGLQGLTRRIKTAENALYPSTLFLPVIEYIQKNIHKVIEVETLAAISALSTSQFRRKFKQAFRLPPLQFILKLRIMKACRWLRSSSMNMGEIAAQCGFENQNYFSRCFRQQMGTTPRQYRKHYTRL